MANDIFNQSHQTVSTQTNINQLTVGPNTPQKGISEIISTVKQQIAQIEGLSPSARQDILTALSAADGKSPSPKNSDIKSKLDAAASTLLSVDGLAEKGIALAATIAKISKWIIAFA